MGLASRSRLTPWVLLAGALRSVAKMRAPHLAQLPTPVPRRPHRGAGPARPQCWMLPARGSDSFCRSGLWVWMSHLFLTLAAAALALPDRGLFAPCPAQGGQHSSSLAAAQHLITSGHKLAAKLPAPSLGFLEIQWSGWQAETQSTGLVKSTQQGPLHRDLHDEVFAAVPEGGWGVVFNLCFFHLSCRGKAALRNGTEGHSLREKGGKLGV